MFRDEAEITVISGKGGDGCMSFRREAFAPKGGPDGGDGGRGGSIIFVADADTTSLLELVRLRIIRAAPGKAGLGKNCSGRSADDVYVKVPIGTLVYDSETRDLLVDLVKPRQEYLIARGGRGGRGNQHFATATHQTPREFEYGSPGQERKLYLELKLIADIGLVGMPNAGKSTLLSICSAARPKIADYPFTTLGPQLGIVAVGQMTFVMADIPGLIEGASQGKGLGLQFLRHIERTRAIVHMIDMTAGEVEELAANYRVIRRELENFSPSLAAKNELVVGNKIDVPEARDRAEALSREIGKEVIPLSAATQENLQPLLRQLAMIVTKERQNEALASPIE